MTRNGLRVRYVRRHGASVHLAGEACHCFPGRIRILTVVDRHPVAAGGEQARCGAANAPRRAGNEYGFMLFELMLILFHAYRARLMTMRCTSLVPS